MKIKYLNIFIFFVALSVKAQIYVSPNSYIFANNQLLFVTQDVELNAAATSNLYLRTGAQLLQKTTAAGANKGLGDLSVYQEGTVNNYQYNYWCSPVGNTLTSTTVNNPFGISQLKQVTGLTSFSYTPFLASSIRDGISSPLQIASRWIYTFTTSSTYAQWNFVGGANTIAAGAGFTMKGTPAGNQQYDFRGKPNDGTINVPVSAGNFTLTGNPYPSAIDLSLFLLDNTLLLDGTALFWEHDKTANSHFLINYRGGYGVYNGATTVYTPATFYTYTNSGAEGPASIPLNINSYKRNFSPIGQGFMVRGVANGNVQFKNTHRVYVQEGIPSNSQFERKASKNEAKTNDSEFYDEILNVAGTDYTKISKNPAPHILINSSLNNEAVRQIALCFMPDAVDGLDKADSKSPDSSLPYDTYFYLDNSEYVHSTTSFEINKRFPLGFKNSSQASFRIQVSNFVNFNEANEVYLYDKETGMYHDIKNAEYEISLPAGVNNTRFEITFKKETLGVNEVSLEDFNIYYNNENNILTIKNPNAIALKSCLLFDVLGKVVFTKTNLGSNLNYEFSTTGLAEGVYIVKLITNANQEVAKKISISNKE
jgi:hypothetical protein